ncbi:Cytochrome c [Granulibacter bethesdensis]|uniref:Cytochrome c n=2 Tax=Granulibacter bethesdensis TaxID=364410 RepID=A0AAC9P810_9PROT|nr:Cytochrome c [Granulibacter bethesdensis]APH61087.1 Cytochrome c [Granulibacter bethesdensis]
MAVKTEKICMKAAIPVFLVMVVVLSGASNTAAMADKAASDPSVMVQGGWSVPDINTLPQDEWGRTVRYGRDLIVRTASLIGPEVADPARRFAGNNLNCQSCHLQGGTKKFGLPLIGVFADFPNYRARSGTVGTIEDRVQGCMQRSMNGKPLPLDGKEMKAIVSYLQFLSTGRPVGAPTLGRGAGSMPELMRAADPVRGQAVYSQVCAACHGQDGQGQRVGRVGDAQGYAVPPLWGTDSFNRGAGMDRLINTANFIRHNMPDGTNWTQPVLSIEDSWDVAAFVNTQPRPVKADLQRDYPNRIEKPVDTPYGPYADGFSRKQHVLGPFQPVRDALKYLRNADR